VTLATFSIRYVRDGRERVLSFDVSFPGSCSLKNKPEEQRLLGEEYLRLWGVAGA
jgi:hypothetical protein